MNVPTIEMKKWEARDVVAEYSAAVKRARAALPDLDERAREQLARDEETLAGALALARGKRLINLKTALKTAGLKPDGTPALAVARADWKLCYFREGHDTRSWTWGFFPPYEPGVRSPLPVAVNLLEVFPQFQPRRFQALEAIVPTIPPRHRPPGRSVKAYHLLWEAEWKGVPVDPMLLRRVSGSLFSVLAVWDLTPLEQAVLGGLRT